MVLGLNYSPLIGQRVKITSLETDRVTDLAGAMIVWQQANEEELKRVPETISKFSMGQTLSIEWNIELTPAQALQFNLFTAWLGVREHSMVWAQQWLWLYVNLMVRTQHMDKQLQQERDLAESIGLAEARNKKETDDDSF